MPFALFPAGIRPIRAVSALKASSLLTLRSQRVASLRISMVCLQLPDKAGAGRTLPIPTPTLTVLALSP